MSRIVLVGALALAGTTGCGLLLDTAYWTSDKRFSRSSEERSPTAESRTAIEYDAVIAPDGRLRLGCERRTRAIERSWETTRTYRYRGGFEPDTYLGVAILDGVFAAVAGVTAGVVCADDDKDVSCWNLMWGAPFALDLGWSIYRHATVKPPKLVDKHQGSARLALARAPSEAEPVACDGVAQIMVGWASGPSEEAALNGDDASPAPRRMSDGAQPVPLDETGALALGGNPAVVPLWAGNPSAELWVVDRAGVAHPVSVDRCAALRPYAGVLQGPALAQFQKDCPPPPPPR